MSSGPDVLFVTESTDHQPAMSLKEQIIQSRIPEHVAIIMDGNGRWATARGLDRTDIHNSIRKFGNVGDFYYLCN